MDWRALLFAHSNRSEDPELRAPCTSLIWVALVYREAEILGDPGSSPIVTR